jgi:hypothetical protein
MHPRFVLATLTLALLLTTSSLAASDTAAASPVVLGSPAFAGHGAEGWGTSRPRRFYNGGDPSGLVKEIQWTSWGGESAIGYGLNAIFKPQGGYYSQPVLVEIRASGLGKCSASGPRAYTHLSIRAPDRPEGPLGPWRAWSEAPNICKSAF